MKTFSIGGVHPSENKLTAGVPIVDLPRPVEVVLPLSQHIGAPARPVVKIGDHVVRGQMIAEPDGFVSVPVHTPVSGKVVKIDKCKTPQGLPVDAVYIKSDEEDRRRDEEIVASLSPVRDDAAVEALESKEIIGIIRDAGIVGMGGAAFPTHVKLSPPKGMVAEMVIVNGAECEPYLTCDDAIMRACPSEIVHGTQLLMRAAGVGRGVIAVENNKPEAIAALSAAAVSVPGVEVMPLKVKYPQGGEKQLIEAVTGREVPSGALPVATGAIVQNVATALAVERAVVYGEPLIERVMTFVSPLKAGNYRVTLGTSMRDIAGELAPEIGKVIVGGPMMGRSASNLDTPVVKATSGLLLFPAVESRRSGIEPCIRCGACVDACPMGLEPYLLSTLSRLHRFDEAKKQKIANCIMCGSCSYACPSSRPVLDFIRIGRAAVMEASRK